MKNQRLCSTAKKNGPPGTALFLLGDNFFQFIYKAQKGPRVRRRRRRLSIMYFACHAHMGEMFGGPKFGRQSTSPHIKVLHSP
mmetsp:Transcript_35476/g.65707  ORF Transcript_35476/g.65707 Transcript_35476/m.65707 type:complete len:83 (-) Transcript_35476:10-258(-)